jgi:hypothetical protein
MLKSMLGYFFSRQKNSDSGALMTSVTLLRRRAQLLSG